MPCIINTVCTDSFQPLSSWKSISTLQDLKKEDSIIMGNGMDVDKRYVLIGKMNAQQGINNICNFCLLIGKIHDVHDTLMYPSVPVSGKRCRRATKIEFPWSPLLS